MAITNKLVAPKALVKYFEAKLSAEVGPHSLNRMIKDSTKHKVTVLDVRAQEDFAVEHIPTAVNMTLDQLEKQFLEHRYSSVISGPWLATQLRKQLGRPIRDDIGITLPPFGGKPVATFVGGSCLGDSGHTAMSPLYRARAFGFG